MTLDHLDSIWQLMTYGLLFGTGLNVLRYVFMAGTVHHAFHRRERPRLRHRKIATRPRPPGQDRRDMAYSLSTMVIFGAFAFLGIVGSKTGTSKMYFDADAYPMWWLVLQVPVMILIHDFYFYWAHRLMHHKRVFGAVHKVHHLSRDPTPLTSYAFHPLEAVVEAGIGPLLVLTLPIQRNALLLFLTIQFAQNVFHHLGYELYPSWFAKTPLKHIFNTTTHHHQHHQKVNCNYGLYLNIWDRLFGTNHRTYDATVDALCDQPLLQDTPDDPALVPAQAH